MKKQVLTVLFSIIISHVSKSQFVKLDSDICQKNGISSLLVVTDSFDGCPVESFSYNENGHVNSYRMSISEEVRRFYYRNGDTLIGFSVALESGLEERRLLDSVTFELNGSGEIITYDRFEFTWETNGKGKGIITHSNKDFPSPFYWLEYKDVRLDSLGLLQSHRLDSLNWPCLMPIRKPLVVNYIYNSIGLPERIEFMDLQNVLLMTWFCLYKVK